MRERGFTLIELMITIAILAIIVAIALPSYQAQVEKGRRADAVTSLMETAQQLERCFTRTSTYENCVSSPEDSQDGYYTITVADEATSYTVTATAKSDGPQSGDDCSPFTLDDEGNKGHGGSDTDRCWGN
ncbi:MULTISPECIES: type IV pilin protein [unclassified Wenzhouxiangella]|uniref:type IV pilin protein n=1 Tax=unclassified Wenzhouxiangella TaxID=2613841 RepID=UPI000E329B2A|nr:MULTISPECIES: type IV pilin protein [unclassified Wenzhouxiangella]RFF27322.1 prepilin-type N-terminal cleavage/methylation domain-containing protein [Wenzhouxiangella sp. 15181]RFP68755.1 prepilin-type N-terminal cleavage/methylation domain-containing protein [Wenzhouxiangella sp. 15190]